MQDNNIFLHYRKTNFKKLAICLTFPSNYPSTHILVELKSKTLSEKLLYGLQGLAEKDAKQYIGKVNQIHVIWAGFFFKFKYFVN